MSRITKDLGLQIEMYDRHIEYTEKCIQEAQVRRAQGEHQQVLADLYETLNEALDIRDSLKQVKEDYSYE